MKSKFMDILKTVRSKSARTARSKRKAPTLKTIKSCGDIEKIISNQAVQLV